MNKERYVGIMSGTSLDGVDVVLCEIDAHTCTLICTREHPMPKELKKDILHMIGTKSSLEDIGKMDHRLGALFAQAVNALLIENNIEASTISAIGSHGQTLWHQPKGTDGFTMQLGDPNIIAVKTGISVVADFRRKDVALGGHGAPFAPAFHEFMFHHMHSSMGVVNIGGMANITVLPHTMDDKLIGYDTGCGNVLLDMWVHTHHNTAYDKEGTWARSGAVDTVLLELMLDDDYFDQPYPKSTGREKFNQAWLETMMAKRCEVLVSPLVAQNVQRTLLELTALSIAKEIERFKLEVVMICGGGAKNNFLLERIQAELPHVEVVIAQDADEIEAMTFAWLAYKRIHKEKVNLKDVTGARENTILGGLYA